MIIKSDIANNASNTRSTDTFISVRDKTGKLFAKMSPDKKRLRIMKHDKYVDIIVNRYGRMQVINK